MPTFDGTEGRAISIATGAGYTRAFRTNYPNNKKAYFVGKDLINDLLAQKDAQGIRIYLGQNIQDDGNIHIMTVLVAADTDQNDIVDICVDEAFPCPSNCDTNNSPLLK